MESLTQEELLADVEHDGRDRARFFRLARHAGLDCLRATYYTHRFPLHTHDTYVFGVVTAGCNTYRLRGGLVRAQAGHVCFINPGEPHDGGAVEQPFSYRMTYPDADWMRALTEDVSGKAQTAAPSFAATITFDEDIAQLFMRGHEALEQQAEGLCADEWLIAAAGLALVRYAGAPAAAPSRAGAKLDRVKALLDEAPELSPSLDDLAGIAGMSRFHLLRAFRREAGLTPHAYLIDARVRRARALLRRGGGLADVAAQCGFADQAHFTRAFKARMGVTPGAFRRMAAM